MYRRFHAHLAPSPDAQPDRRDPRIQPERLRRWTHVRRPERIKCGGGYRILRKPLPLR
jgi:hypothetical protein